MPHAKPEDRRCYMNARALRLRHELSEKGAHFRHVEREVQRKYRERHRAKLRAEQAAAKRLQRSTETPEEREVRLAAVRRWRTQEKNAFYLFIRLLRRHDMTLDQYHSMLEKQDFSCAICRKAFWFGIGLSSRQRSAHLDHCHDTNRVRGLLCANCNVGIGHLQESPELFERAAAYVTRHKKLKADKPFIEIPA